MDSQLKFSVLMSVYWRERPEYLAQCLNSLVVQTVKVPEVILVEDGPIGDGLKKIIESFKPLLNIRSVILKSNQGLASALNEGLHHCSYDLVARMDTDDICVFDRFEKQLAFMLQHPEVSVCGGYSEEYDEKMEKSFGIRLLPLGNNQLIAFAKKRSPFSHMTVMFRKSNILKVGGYPPLYPEDYALWSLLIVKQEKLANIPQVLVYVRSGDQLAKRRGFNFFVGEVSVFKFQREIGFLNSYEFWRNVNARFFLRTLPVFLRRFLYKYARNIKSFCIRVSR